MMKRIALWSTMGLFCVQMMAKAENDEIVDNDTIRMMNVDEVVITSSTKETNDFRTLPSSVSVFTPQQINGRQISALKDLSSFVPNLYIPDYGSRMTSAIYIRGIGARSSGQSIGMYVDDVPYLDKSTFDFERHPAHRSFARSAGDALRTQRDGGYREDIYHFPL